MGKAKAFLAGIGLAYLLDPRQGRRRRKVLADRSARVVRRTGRHAQKKARYLGGVLRGLFARSRRLVARPDVAVDDATVEQRIRSDALRDVGVAAHDVDIRVERGVVTLRGSVEGRTLADDLVARVRKVPGVRDVAAMLKVTTTEEEGRAAA